jgi:tRNA modification GTPase
MHDTIAAPATPAGTSALALVRVSGSAVGGLAETIFGEPGLLPRVATHRSYRGLSGAMLDDVIVTRYVAPNSFTGEDLLEISTHGNPLIVQLVMADLLARGCRPAEPGEFTRRAFLLGRMDLAQAEAVMDVIHARSEKALAVAQRQLQGGLGRHLSELVEHMVEVIAFVEAYIDFPEEDLPAEDNRRLAQQLTFVLRGTERLLATHRYGDLLREGLRTVLLGVPNVGKSSLLNALLGRERALVSAEPGTTRDYLEERLVVDGQMVRLIDTAGLNASADGLERRGIEKTVERAAEADLVLIVLDAQHPVLPALPEQVLGRLSPANTWVAINKADLVRAPRPGLALPYPALWVSAQTGEGLPELAAAIAAVADRCRPDFGEDVIAINARHANALGRARQALEDARVHLHTSAPVELLAADCREALVALGEIGGRIDHEQILDKLFATFCIGK